MSYHLVDIEKGQVGEFSKIVEEFRELADAVRQGDKILQLCELSDLYGAIEEYMIQEFRMSMYDLKSVSDKTKSAFKSGTRK